MKTRLSIGLALALFLPFAPSVGADTALQDSIKHANSIGALVKIGDLIENTWPTNASDYFQSQNQLNAALQP